MLRLFKVSCIAVLLMPVILCNCSKPKTKTVEAYNYQSTLYYGCENTYSYNGLTYYEWTIQELDRKEVYG